MSDLIVIAFPTEAKAEEVRQKLLAMQKEYLIELGAPLLPRSPAKTRTMAADWRSGHDFAASDMTFDLPQGCCGFLHVRPAYQYGYLSDRSARQLGLIEAQGKEQS